MAHNNSFLRSINNLTLRPKGAEETEEEEQCTDPACSGDLPKFLVYQQEERNLCPNPTVESKPSSTRIHIMRHGEALHNVDKDYIQPDPPLTGTGEVQVVSTILPATPDLIIVSPLTRTIATAILAFGNSCCNKRIEVWPDLRESNDATCNRGVSRAELFVRHPDLDFSQCAATWNYPPHSFEYAAFRAERVRRRLRDYADRGGYRNIYLVTHRGFIAFLVQGARFDLGECRSYRFANGEAEAAMYRKGHNIDEEREQDFGPTPLIQVPGGRRT